MSDQRQVVITVNGPGETAGWVYPVATHIKRAAPAVRVVVAALPCVFATGAETVVAAAMPVVDGVCTPAESLRFALRGVRPPAVHPGETACVLQLGGEPVLSLAIARRLGCPALAFAERPIPLQFLFHEVMLRDTAGARNSRPAARVVGDLVVDAARLRCPQRLPVRSGGVLTVGLFGGSRIQLLRHTLPFFVQAAGLAQRELEPVRWIIARADFVEDETIRRVLAHAADRALEGDSAVARDSAIPRVLTSDRGVRLEIAPLPEALSQVDVAVTIPGTANGELAAHGVPAIVAAPYRRLYEVPLPGLPGHLNRLPLVGRPLKCLAVLAHGRRFRQLGYANIRAGRMIAPELRGRIRSADVAAGLVTLARSDLGATGRALQSAMGPPGAAAAVAARVLRRCESAVRT